MTDNKYTFSEDPVIHEAVRQAYANNNLRYSHALSDPRFSWNEDKQFIGDINFKYNYISDDTSTHVYTPEYSEWMCYLFGGDDHNGIAWRPLKGEHPNWFWRKMQYLCFGNKWVKDITK